MAITGGCHCGKLSYTLDEDVPSEGMTCNCSICRRHGYIHHFTTPEKFTAHGSDEDAAIYTFNKHVIRHRFCKTCGSHPYGDGTMPDGKRMIEINLRCADGIDLDALDIKQVDGASF